jgi:integrase
MASIDKVGPKRYRARWRTLDGASRSKTFGRKIDAEMHLVMVEGEKLRGTYVDPRLRRMTLGDYATGWLERMRTSWRASTYKAVAISVRRHIVPTLGSRPLNTLRRSDVERWAASLNLAPSTVSTVRQHLGQILAAAVDDGLISRSPATGARLPKVDSVKPQPVPAAVVEAITAACPSWFRLAIPLGLGAGLRQGEAAGLTVDRVDFLRRTLRVDRQLVTSSGGAGHETPKSLSSFRTIPLADFVLDALAAHIAEHGTGEAGLILHQPDGRPVDSNRFGAAWRAARRKVGAPEVDYHDLRHTFASTLLSQGVSVKAVADWLGHASPW